MSSWPTFKANDPHRARAIVAFIVDSAPDPEAARQHLAPIYWSPGIRPIKTDIARWPTTGYLWDECIAGLGQHHTIHSMNGLVLYLPAQD